MINRTALIALAGVTAVLFIAAAAIGNDNDVLWVLDDIVFFGFIACLLALIVLSIGVLMRSVTRSGR